MGPVNKIRGPVEFVGARKYGLGARDKKIRGPVEFLGARKYALGAREKIEIPLCPFSTLTTALYSIGYRTTYNAVIQIGYVPEIALVAGKYIYI